ncbi:MAG: hypothetical protein ACK43L_05060 [Sphingobacteriales bacterium]
MKKSRMLAMFFLMTSVGLITSCGKDDHDHDEEELITSVNVVVTETGTTNVQTFSFKDSDGPGGLAPTKFDSIILNANKSYAVSLEFLNESTSPAENITTEIKAEANDHQLYFQPTGVALNVSNLDADSKGLPLGLTSTWTAGAPGNGSIKITLKHKPAAKAAGDPVTKGETDVELDFGVRLR